MRSTACAFDLDYDLSLLDAFDATGTKQAEGAAAPLPEEGAA